MPNTTSATKALRQSETRRVRNQNRKNAYKDAVKEFRKQVAAGNVKDAARVLPRMMQQLDKATKTGIIKKNKASRLKSNAAMALAKLSKK